MEALPQSAHCCSTGVDGDNDELATEARFDDGLRGRAVEGDTCDNTLDLARSGVALSFGDLSREDDVFKIED